MIRSYLWMLILAPGSPLADTVYHWIDDLGVPHFSNLAPASPLPGSRTLQLHPVQTTVGNGLRPGERQALRNAQQRARRDELRSQAARRHSDRVRDRQQQRCADQRKKLRTARGKESFKKHSRFLRTHCW